MKCPPKGKRRERRREIVKHSRQVIRSATLSLLLMLGATRVIGQGSENSSSGQAPSSTVSSVFLRILPGRIEPAAVTVKSGSLTIIVQNSSTAPNVSMELHQVRGKHLRTVSMARGQRHSLETYDLAPGSYVLSEVNHPDWHCTISVK